MAAKKPRPKKSGIARNPIILDARTEAELQAKIDASLAANPGYVLHAQPRPLPLGGKVVGWSAILRWKRSGFVGVVATRGNR